MINEIIHEGRKHNFLDNFKPIERDGFFTYIFSQREDPKETYSKFIIDLGEYGHYSEQIIKILRSLHIVGCQHKKFILRLIVDHFRPLLKNTIKKKRHQRKFIGGLFSTLIKAQYLIEVPSLSLYEHPKHEIPRYKVSFKFRALVYG